MKGRGANGEEIDVGREKRGRERGGAGRGEGENRKENWCYHVRPLKANRKIFSHLSP